MPLQHPYIDSARRAILIHDLDKHMPIVEAAVDSGINIKTARGIKRRTDQISRVLLDSSVSLPSVYNIEERIQVASKSGRPRILSELQINTLDKGIEIDRKHREIGPFKVAKEL